MANGAPAGVGVTRGAARWVWPALAALSVALTLWLYHDGFRRPFSPMPNAPASTEQPAAAPSADGAATMPAPARSVRPVPAMPFRWSPQRVDEKLHFEQITNYLKGDYSFHPKLAMLPGYHATVALLGKTLGFGSLPAVRLVSVLSAFIAAAVFFVMCRQPARDAANTSSTAFPEQTLDTSRLPGAGAWERTAQFFYLPVFFPFIFLVYSDPMSLVVLFLMLLAALRRWHTLAGVIALIALLFRQNNIFWVSLALAITYTQAEGWRFTMDAILRHAKRAWMLIVAHAAFVAFVIINGGVAIHDKASNPLGLYRGNLFLALMCVALFFLPLHLANLRAIASLLRRRPIVCAAVAAVVAALYFTYETDHYYNYDAYMLKNWVLIRMKEDALFRIGVFAAVLLALASLAVTKLRSPSLVWLYPFALLSLVTPWVVEPRYWIIPLTLFIYARAGQPAWVERATAALHFVLALIVFRGMERMVWFP